MGLFDKLLGKTLQPAITIKAKGRIKHMCRSKYHLDMQEGEEKTLTGDDVADGIYCVQVGWATNVDTGEDNEPDRAPVTLKMK